MAFEKKSAQERTRETLSEDSIDRMLGGEDDP